MTKDYAFVHLFRALAAFWVLSAHCQIWGGWYGLPIPNPKIAVDLFMMISGYLMAANAHARSAHEPLDSARNWLRFWLRRFFRIAPAYYVALLLAVAGVHYIAAGIAELRELNPARWANDWIYSPDRVHYSLKNLILHFSFAFGLHPAYSLSTSLPDWSLSLEMQFYLAFPLLMIVMNKLGHAKTALLMGSVSMAVGLLIAQRYYYFEPSLLFFKLHYFIAGILAFLCIHHTHGKLYRAGLLLSALLLCSLEVKYGVQLVIAPLLLAAMAALGLAEQRMRLPSWLLRSMKSRVVLFAANTSYSVYLFQMFFFALFGLIIASRPELQSLAPPQRVLALFVFATLTSYTFAYLVFRWVELPGIALGKRVIDRWVPASSAPTSYAAQAQTGLPRIDAHP